MARPRRLRHKLMFGLALVVISVALLLGGTLYGINAYLSTVKTTERKLEELEVVNILIRTLSSTNRPAGTDMTAEYADLRARVDETKGYLNYYRDDLLPRTVRAGLDPDNGNQEQGLIAKLDAALQQLDYALRSVSVEASDANQPIPSSLHAHPRVRPPYDESRHIAEHLRLALIGDIETGIRRSNATIRQSLWIVGASFVQLLLIVLALLYYFREWIYAPIKALQGGVQRVHAGDFDHPIRLTSRDELEELATEFNAMTARLSAIYKDLARQVNERSRQLVRSERMVSVGFLAAGVAHEINNPLASILFCAEALERRLQDVLAQAADKDAAPSETEVLTRYLKMIQQEALRCKDITQKLLDFSRTGERKREPTDLAGLIRGVLEVARHLPNCRGKNIAFNPDAYVLAPVNAQDLKSVILNLVVNALDSMDENGTLTIQLRADATVAEMAFTDTGCGMPADVLQNIFEPFFTRSRTGKGTGLGLFISHQIVDQHGGQIEAASPGPGHGSTFTVRLPLRETPGEPLPLGPAPDGEQSDSEAVLPFPGKRAA